ncbi:MAG: ATP-dependent Clp protease adaptor ClpS [Bacteroidia bacterium]|nr:ATP-dependent Clp protease adaptor ClpS [Bacteroidia bacterium]
MTEKDHETLILELTETTTEVLPTYALVVYNDDVNTFDHVISTLMRVCKHTYEQATQCTYLIHYKGKYAVKHGSLKELKPMHDAILDEGIWCKIEK